MRVARSWTVIAICVLGLGACTDDAGPTLAGTPHSFAFSWEEIEWGGPGGRELWLDATGHVEGHWTLLSQTDTRHCRGELMDSEWGELAAQLNSVRALTRADSAGCPGTIDLEAWNVCVTPTDAPMHCFVYGCPYEPSFDDLLALLRSVLARIDAEGACGPDSYPF